MAKFYVCKVCDNLVEMVEDSGNIPFCCNRPMQHLQHGQTDGAKEKHVPVIEEALACGPVIGLHVTVGSAVHPSESYHYIEWIALVTDQGIQKKKLNPGDLPRVSFYIGTDETVIAAYAYCNLHGLWKGGSYEHGGELL